MIIGSGASTMRATRTRALAACLGLLGACLPLAHGNTNAGYLERPEVRAFIGDLSRGHGLDAAQLERILGEARHQATVVRLIGPERVSNAPPPVRSYPAYRARFLTRSRIAAGVRYWEAHAADLQRAEAQYGVPAEVILGIIGVETAFGQNTGSFRVLDALATIAFDGPRRQQYFRDELKQFLLLSNEKGLDPLEVRGSYAGAMGLPQFMPSSYRRLAVDFDRDGRTDLIGTPADAIGSVAAYLRDAGWVAGEPATVAVRLPKGREAELVSGLKRSHDVPGLRKAGVRFAGDAPDGACAIVELPTPRKASRYVAGFGNFEAVTRYNRSTFYAMAVLELAEAIRTARGRESTVGNDPPRSPAS
jgi:membrane-bound lytic murein transglycosylase B